MSLSRWDPFRELQGVQRMLDRMWDEGLSQRISAANQSYELALPIDMTESDNSFVVKAPVPGIKPDDLDISVDGNTLTIRGETREEEEKTGEHYLYRERRFGRFGRSVTLPSRVQADKADAVYQDGMLILTLPKSEEVQRKSIPIKGSKQITEGKTA